MESETLVFDHHPYTLDKKKHPYGMGMEMHELLLRNTRGKTVLKLDLMGERTCDPVIVEGDMIGSTFKLPIATTGIRHPKTYSSTDLAYTEMLAGENTCGGSNAGAPNGIYKLHGEL